MSSSFENVVVGARHPGQFLGYCFPYSGLHRNGAPLSPRLPGWARDAMLLFSGSGQA